MTKFVLSITGLTQSIAAIAKITESDPTIDLKDVTLLINGFGQDYTKWLEVLRGDLGMTGGVHISSVFAKESGIQPVIGAKLFATVGFSYCVENEIPNLLLDMFTIVLPTEAITQAIEADKSLANAQSTALGGGAVEILYPLVGKNFDEVKAIATAYLETVYASLEPSERADKINEILEA